MAKEFNPYHAWLDVPPDVSRPNYFQLLGLTDHATCDQEVMQAAVHRGLLLRAISSGISGQEAIRLEKEVELARKALLDHAFRRQYVHALKANKPLPVYHDTGHADALDDDLPPVVRGGHPYAAPMASPVASNPWATPIAATAVPTAVAMVQRSPGGVATRVASPAPMVLQETTDAMTASNSEAAGVSVTSFRGARGRGPSPVTLILALFVVGGGIAGSFGLWKMLHQGEPALADNTAGAADPAAETAAEEAAPSADDLSGDGAAAPGSNNDAAPDEKPETPRSRGPLASIDGPAQSNGSAPMPTEGMADMPEGDTPEESMPEDGMPESGDPDAAMPSDADPDAPEGSSPEGSNPDAPETPGNMPKPEQPEPAASGDTPPTDMPADNMPADADLPLTGKALQQYEALRGQVVTQLAQRKTDKAKSLLAAFKPESPTAGLSARLDRLNSLTHYVEGFWDAVEKSAAGMQGGEELTIKDKVLFVVESSKEMVVLRIEGQNLRLPPKRLPDSIAYFFADRWLNDDPANQIFLAAFLAINPGSDRAKARQLWERAGSQGLPTQELLSLLDELESAPADSE